MKLIGSKSSTDEIRIENRGNVAQTNQIDQFDIAHEGLLLEMLRCVTSRDFLWHRLTFDNMYLDVGDIIGVLFRIEHKETFLSKKPKWSLHSISIETCRKLSNEQGTLWSVRLGTILKDPQMLSITSLVINFTRANRKGLNKFQVFRFKGVFQKCTNIHWYLLRLNLK